MSDNPNEPFLDPKKFIPADPNRFLGTEDDIRIITLEEALRRKRERREELRRMFGDPKKSNEGSETIDESSG